MGLRELMDSLPNSFWSITFLVIFVAIFVLFIKFNRLILDTSARIRNWVVSKVSRGYGGALRNVNKRFKRSAYLKREGLSYKVYRFFDDVIVNLNLTKNNVTVFGLLLFTGIISLTLTICAYFILQLDIFMAILAWAVFCVFIIVIFRFLSLGQKEKREGQIMDAVDLLVSDIKGGVYNAIVRYMESFHPDIRPYFLEFVDNIQTKGLTFKSAMNTLNERLGVTFSDFAHKAIMYEEKADSGLEDIFSAIIETNRLQRLLRAANNIAFAQIMQTLSISVAMIGLFAVYIISTEATVRTFLLENAVGKFMLIADVLVFAIIMGYLTGLKAKSFED